MLLLALTIACGGSDKATSADPTDDTGGADDTAIAGPDRICYTDGGWSGGALFEDRTETWGLAGITGTHLTAADLDGDGYPDLVVTEGNTHARDDFDAGERYHWLLMNRPGDDGGRVFVDATEDSGLFAVREGEGGRSAQIHVFGDVDNDGDLDVFSGSFYDGNNPETDPGDRSELLLNDGAGNFALAAASDIAVEDGFATAGAAFTDFDADGLLDLWVVGWYEQYGYVYADQDQLYRGNGDGTFTEVTDGVGLSMIRGGTTASFTSGRARRPAYGATACDLNGDAWPDLLATNYGRSWNQQWMNDAGTSFSDVSMESGFASDDNLDYSDNQYYRCWCEYYGCDTDPGAASLDCSAGYYAYWSPGWDDQPFRLAGNSFTTACGDVDNDGDMDVITAEIVHWHIGGSSDPTELLLNDGTGSFTRPGIAASGMERDWPSRSWNAGDLSVALADLDLDGQQDILLVSSDYPDDRMFLWRQDSQAVFQEIAEEAGIDHPWPAGMVIADLDLDGDLDVATGSSNARSGSPWSSHEIHLYESVLAPTNHARVSLVGDNANRAGIGARVALTAGGVTQTAEVSGGYGLFGIQHDVPLTFGLGDACDIDEITVTWPGGATETWTDIQANYWITLDQGGAATYQ